jgi:uncharacterized PurR-regulated membrane protein YhhQ (DUF165 family)
LELCGFYRREETFQQAEKQQSTAKKEHAYRIRQLFVGASMLAKAVSQLIERWQEGRLREQARSHIGFRVGRENWGRHSSSVGASLLAKALGQLIKMWLVSRHREQARSHSSPG